jgi:hypothetical protein
MSTDSGDRHGHDARPRRRSARRRPGAEREGRRPKRLPGPLRWLDEQLGIVTLANAAFRRVFPDH